LKKTHFWLSKRWTKISVLYEKNKMNCELMLTYDTPALRQTGSRNLMGPKVTKYQISAINSCWEKCDEKCAYMFNVYKNQISRNLTCPKTLPTIWYTYMTLVTKYQISAINSYWEKCDEKYPGRTEVKQYTPSSFGERGYNNNQLPQMKTTTILIILGRTSMKKWCQLH
jgi:hypothetical protein